MKQSLFHGLCTALVTPFVDGGVNYPLLRILIERQIAGGAQALVIAGTTGEAATLTQAEKLKLFRFSAQCAAGRCKIIAGTGSNNTQAAVSLTQAAGQTGADAVLCVTPYYNKCSQEGLLRHFSAVADASELPVILYNVPGRTGVDLDAKTLAALCRHPRIAGLKEASADLAKLFRIRALCGKQLPLYCGNDDRIVPFYAAGGVGVISVWSNLFPAEASQLCRLCEAGDYPQAADLQTAAQPLIDALFAEVNPIPVKAAMEILGLDCGPCRLPLTPCPPALQHELSALLQPR